MREAAKPLEQSLTCKMRREAPRVPRTDLCASLVSSYARLVTPQPAVPHNCCPCKLLAAKLLARPNNAMLCARQELRTPLTVLGVQSVDEVNSNHKTHASKDSQLHQQEYSLHLTGAAS